MLFYVFKKDEMGSITRIFSILHTYKGIRFMKVVEFCHPFLSIFFWVVDIGRTYAWSIDLIFCGEVRGYEMEFKLSF